MKVYLVRHGKTEYNEQGIVQGTLPVPLSKAGELKCRELREKIKDIKLDACISSPIFRAFQTAMILVGDRIEIEKNDLLREREIKILEGRSKKDIEIDPENYGEKDGIEQNKHVFKRCEKFVKHLKENYKDKSVLIVSHGIVIQCLHIILHDEEYNDDLTSVEIGNCYFEEIDIK